MKKNILLSILLSFFFSFLFAQPTRSNYSISIGAGPSIPGGSFAEKKLYDQQTGFAKTGQHLGISLLYKMTPRFGFIATLHGQKNTVDNQSLATQFSAASFSPAFFSSTTTTPPPSPSTPSPYRNWAFVRSSWMMGSLLLGVYAEQPIGKSPLSLLAKATTGPVYVSSPKMNGKSVTDTAIASVERKSYPAWGIAFNFSGGLQYRLTNKLQLFAEAAYLLTNQLVFKKTLTTFNGAQNSSGNPDPLVMEQGSYIVNDQQVIRSLNINAGVRFPLNSQ